MPTHQILSITPSRDTPRGISQGAVLLRALQTLEWPFSLEIVQEPQHVTLQLVAPAEAMPLVLAHSRRLFAAAELKVTALSTDPAQPAHGETFAACELRLGSSPFLPLQIFDDKLEGSPDPLAGLCSLTDSLAAGERVVAQVMLAPASGWPPKNILRARQPEPQPNIPLLNLLCGGGLLLSAVIFILRQNPNVVQYGCVLGLLAAIGAWIYWYKANSPFPFQLDPKLVEEKVNDVGFHTTIRLLAFSSSLRRADQLLKALAAGYGQFNRGRGNHFETHPLPELDGPRQPRPTPFWTPKHILTAAEIAGLWHLPLRVADIPYLDSAMHRPAHPPREV